MKIEKLRKDNRKRILLVAFAILSIASAIFFVGTKAKYKYTNNYPLVNGVISYAMPDISITAIYIQNEEGEYILSESEPENGYILNSSKSYCGITENGQLEKKEDLKITYINGNITVLNADQKGVKCHLYYDKGICDKACEAILANNSIDNSRSSGEFTSVFEENTTGRIFSSEDNDGPTYFFAGSNPNNWVQFAGYYWRIVRVNGDGTIRLIYNGPTTDETGDTTQIETNFFNEQASDNAYVGYMYGTPGSDNYNDTHANINDSAIKKVVDKWYQDNLLNTEYEKYIDLNAGFCGDRESSTSYTTSNKLGGTGSTLTYYGGFIRFTRERIWSTNQKPTYNCQNSNDLYTVASALKGNKNLTYPVGLINVDEVAMSGAIGGVVNQNYWLHTAKDYWTLTPSVLDGNAQVFGVATDGALYWNKVDNSYGIRPVINLKANTVLNGTGTASDPYICGTI